MLGDRDTASVTIVLALCLINEKNRRWIKERYIRRPRHRQENLMADLMLSEPKTIFFFVIFDGPGGESGNV
jgi:hypothetical protein